MNYVTFYSGFLFSVCSFFVVASNNVNDDVKVKYPCYRPPWPRGAQEVKILRFLDTRHMKVVRSSPLRTGRLYPQETRNILVLIF